MSLATVKTAIMNVLNAVPDATAFSYEPKAFQKLPAITLSLRSLEQRRHAFGMGQPIKHEVTYTFDLRLYVAMGSDNKTATELVDTLVDKYMTEFRKDLSLGGVVQAADILRGDLVAVTDVQNPYFRHTFILQVIEEV